MLSLVVFIFHSLSINECCTIFLEQTNLTLASESGQIK